MRGPCLLLLLLLLLLAVGCAPKPRTPRLHELAEWQGSVRLTLAGADAGAAVQFDGELTFHRGNRVFQLTRRGERTVALARLADGEVRAFVDGRPATPGAEDRAQVALASAVVDPGGGLTVHDLADGYELRLGDGRRVIVHAVPQVRGHGQR